MVAETCAHSEKIIYVWLDHLTKAYGRPITKLHEIPAEELETLKTRACSGLWLIGLWERSPASQKIKKLCGNPEAVPSAYSLFDYQIAEDLGGENAYREFRDTAWNRAIDLPVTCAESRPAFTLDGSLSIQIGLYLGSQPFSLVHLGGVDLSHVISRFINEDHYYSTTDAAVVFKLKDRGLAASTTSTTV
jgi:hypothetical protein